jgi:hypothetical protein
MLPWLGARRLTSVGCHGSPCRSLWIPDNSHLCERGVRSQHASTALGMHASMNACEHDPLEIRPNVSRSLSAWIALGSFSSQQATALTYRDMMSSRIP